MKKTNPGKPISKLVTFFFRIFRIKILSIYQLTLIMLIFTAIVSVLLVTSLWVLTETKHVKNSIAILKQQTLANQKQKLKNEVYRVLYYLEYRKNDTLTHSISDIQNEVLDYFKDIRFGNDGYIFINTYDGFALLFDGQKIDSPKNISDLTDPEGFKIFQKELELTKLPDGGYFNYLFKKISDNTPQPKISYVKGFDEWGWIIGTGDYFDNITEEINRLENEIKHDLYQNILTIIGVFLSTLLFLILFAALAAKTIQNQFNKFVYFLKHASLNNINRLPFDQIFIRELKAIGFDILRAQELAKHFGDIIDQSENEIYIFDQIDLHFVHANKGALQNCGYSLSELQSMSPLDLKPELTKEQYLAFIEPLKQKHIDQIQFETVHQRKNKTLYPVEVHISTSIFYQKPIFVAFIYDITKRKEVEHQLQLSQQRYSNLFKNAPISLWEEDFTKLIEYLDEQLKQSNLPIQLLLEENPEILQHCSDLVKVIDVNRQTLKLLEANTKEELLGNLSKIFINESFYAFKQIILAFYQGEKYFSIEGKNRSLSGNKLDLLIRWAFLPQSVDKSQKVIVSMVDITGLRKTEQELISSERRLRSVFENDHIAMLLIDPADGRFINVNPAAIGYYGYSKEQFLNQITIYDLASSNQESVLTRMKETLSKKSTYFDLEHRLANGDIRNVEVYSSLLLFGDKTVLFSVVHDSTEKHQAKLALEASKYKLESIFRAAPTGIGVATNRIFTEVNNRFCEMTGYSQKELIGKNALILYQSKEEYERTGTEVSDHIKEKKTGSIESRFKQKNGTIIDVQISFTPYDLNNPSAEVTFTCLDITERKAALKELEKHRNHLEELVKERTHALEESQAALLDLVKDLNRQSQKLEKANNRLEDINEELETFTYSVSHDLKAPLRGIDGYSQLLLENLSDEINPEARQFLENIRASTEHMNLLIEDLLAYSRMERKDFQPQNVNLNSVVNSILNHFSKTISENKIEINKTIPEDFTLSVDKEGLNLVLRNLVDNSIKFSAHSKTPKIELGCSESETHWLIFVKDNGIGFDMNYRDRIFKIFQRLHLAEEYAGTGIGLAMVIKAVQRMNGKIWAESEIGKGACFYVEIWK